jgi:hypothetical protein
LIRVSVDADRLEWREETIEGRRRCVGALWHADERAQTGAAEPRATELGKPHLNRVRRAGARSRLSKQPRNRSLVALPSWRVAPQREPRGPWRTGSTPLSTVQWRRVSSADCKLRRLLRVRNSHEQERMLEKVAGGWKLALNPRRRESGQPFGSAACDESLSPHPGQWRLTGSSSVRLRNRPTYSGEARIPSAASASASWRHRLGRACALPAPDSEQRPSPIWLAAPQRRETVGRQNTFPLPRVIVIRALSQFEDVHCSLSPQLRNCDRSDLRVPRSRAIMLGLVATQPAPLQLDATAEETMSPIARRPMLSSLSAAA